MERELATTAPRTHGGAESHSGQRARVAPFELQMQATVADALPPARDAPAWRGWHQANCLRRVSLGRWHARIAQGRRVGELQPE